MIRFMQKSDRSSLIDILRSTHMFTRQEIDVAIEQMDLFVKYKKASDYTLMVVENADSDVVGFMSFGPAPMAKGVYDLYWIAVRAKCSKSRLWQRDDYLAFKTNQSTLGKNDPR